MNGTFRISLPAFILLFLFNISSSLEVTTLNETASPVVNLTLIAPSPQNLTTLISSSPQNLTLIASEIDLQTASSKKNRRQSSKGQQNRSGKPKSKSYSGPDSYLQVYESKPESYSTSYHHKGEEPSVNYDVRRRSGTRRNSGNNRRNDEDADSDRGRRSRSRRGDDEDEDLDEDDAHSDSGGRSQGYSSGTKFNKEQRDDYQKSGKLGLDSDDYGFDGKRSSGRRGREREGRERSSGREDEDYGSSDTDARGERSNRRDYGDDEDYRSASSTDRDYRGGSSSKDRDYEGDLSHDDISKGFEYEDDDGGREGREGRGGKSRGGRGKSRNSRRRDEEPDYEANDEDGRSSRLSREYGRSSPSRHYISAAI